MANIEFAGFLYDDAGAAINGATVNLYDRNTVTPVRATTTTNSSGYYSISHATEGRFDVEIVNGSSKRRLKYDDAIQLQEVETANLLIRNPANTFKYDIVPAAIAADRQLNLPLITATDTLMSLGLNQTFSAELTFSSNSANGAVQMNDNSVIAMGTGSDSKLSYDGTDVVFELRSTGDGDLLVGGNIKINSTPTNTDRSSIEAGNALYIFNGTAPSGTLANGITLYSKDVSSSAELHVMDEAGNETLLSPHDGREWVFYSENQVTGRKIRVKMEQMMKRLDEMLGGGYIEEEG